MNDPRNLRSVRTPVDLRFAAVAVAAIIGLALGAGCKGGGEPKSTAGADNAGSKGALESAGQAKSGGAAEAAEAAPEAAADEAPSRDDKATADGAGTATEGAADKAAAEGGAAAEGAVDGGEAKEPTLDPAAQKVDAKLREFFALLAKSDPDAARNLMLTTEQCKTLWVDGTVCDKVADGQDEGFKELVADPVPNGSEIVSLAPGQRQAIGEDKGLKAETGIWVGSLIHGRAPNGHEFAMKSLGVIEVGDDLRIIWGKRRSGPDSLRNPKEGGPVAAPPEGAQSSGGAAAPSRDSAKDAAGDAAKKPATAPAKPTDAPARPADGAAKPQ